MIFEDYNEANRLFKLFFELNPEAEHVNVWDSSDGLDVTVYKTFKDEHGDYFWREIPREEEVLIPWKDNEPDFLLSILQDFAVWGADHVEVWQRGDNPARVVLEAHMEELKREMKSTAYIIEHLE